MYRLFETGDLAEDRFASNLRAIGCTVHTVNDDGNQYAVSAYGGHFSGHMDGCILGLPEAPSAWHVGEFKTHNTKNFRKLKSHGVKESFPKHYCQMMIYMHLTGMKRAFYFAVLKDTDELYSERIHYNEHEAKALMSRAERIIKAQEPPQGVSDRPDWWQCKFCDARGICFGSLAPNPILNVPSLSCRQCCYATPSLDGIDGRWVCEKKKKALSENEQQNPCDGHLILPGLIRQFPHVECTRDENGNDRIIFQDDSGGTFIHGSGKHCFNSEELTMLPAPVLLSPMVTRAKDVFAGEATGCCEDILDRYPESDCEIVWSGTINGLLEELAARIGFDTIDKGPIARTNLPTHCVSEYEGDIIAVAFINENRAEIRKGKT
jgi:hypothetical protein